MADPEHIGSILARVLDDLAKRYEGLRINEKVSKETSYPDVPHGSSGPDSEGLFSDIQS